MLKIKLYPRGKKHQRTFRIVVAERRSKFNGKFVEDLGNGNDGRIFSSGDTSFATMPDPCIS